MGENIEDKEDLIRNIGMIAFLILYPIGLSIHSPPPGKQMDPITILIFWLITIPLIIILLGYYITFKIKSIYSVNAFQKILARFPFLKEPVLMSIKKKEKILYSGLNVRDLLNNVDLVKMFDNFTKIRVLEYEKQLGIKFEDFFDYIKEDDEDEKKVKKKNKKNRSSLSRNVFELIKDAQKQIEFKNQIKFEDIDLKLYTIDEIKNFTIFKDDEIEFLEMQNIKNALDLKENYQKTLIEYNQKFLMMQKNFLGLQEFEKRFKDREFEKSCKKLFEAIFKKEKEFNFKNAHKIFKKFLKLLILAFKIVNSKYNSYIVIFEKPLDMELPEQEILYIDESESGDFEKNKDIKTGLLVLPDEWENCFDKSSEEIYWNGFPVKCTDVTHVEAEIKHLLIVDLPVIIINYCDLNRKSGVEQFNVEDKIIAKIEVEALLYMFNDLLKGTDKNKKLLGVKDAALEKKDLENEEIIQHILDTISPDRVTEKPLEVEPSGINLVYVSIVAISLFIFGIILGKVIL